MSQFSTSGVIAELLPSATCNRLVKFYKVEEGVTPSEPIYPDLTQGPAQVPDYVAAQLEGVLDFDTLEIGEDMVYLLPMDLLNTHFDYDFAQFFGLEEAFEERSRMIFDTDSLESADYLKAPTTGRPANNNDPYPADEKIRQLQAHSPSAKIQSITRCEPSSEFTQLVENMLAFSDRTEKRLVQLENITSTAMHYLYRSSSRMQVNCVYYGGQNETKKYQAIRCLRDDLINDGQHMSLDQCLNCTRYEPIIGKVYDILDDYGHNLKLIQDDNQKAYRGMEEYFDLILTERMHTEQEFGKLGFENRHIKPEGHTLFSEEWPEGHIMNWQRTPAETQLPLVNPWGNSASNNASLHVAAQSDYFSVSTNIEYSRDITASINLDLADIANNPVQDLQEHVENGKLFAASAVPATLKNMQEHGYESLLMSLSKEGGVDPALMLAIIAVESTGRPEPSNDRTTSFWGLMQVAGTSLPSHYMQSSKDKKMEMNIRAGVAIYNQKGRAIRNTTNPMVRLLAYNAGEGMILGVSTRQNVNSVVLLSGGSLSWDNINHWRWQEVIPHVMVNSGNFYGQRKIREVATYYPRIIECYNLIKNHIGKNPLDAQVLAGDLAFPIPVNHLSVSRLTSPFGMRSRGMHRGIDFSMPIGTPLVAVADGVVHLSRTNSGGVNAGYGHYIVIKHDNGLYSLCGHLNRLSPFKETERVRKGQIICESGNTGTSSGPHLHFEMHEGRFSFGTTNKDPVFYFPALRPIVNRFLDQNRASQSLSVLKN